MWLYRSTKQPLFLSRNRHPSGIISACVFSGRRNWLLPLAVSNVPISCRRWIGKSCTTWVWFISLLSSTLLLFTSSLLPWIYSRTLQTYLYRWEVSKFLMATKRDRMKLMMEFFLRDDKAGIVWSFSPVSGETIVKIQIPFRYANPFRRCYAEYYLQSKLVLCTISKSVAVSNAGLILKLLNFLSCLFLFRFVHCFTPRRIDRLLLHDRNRAKLHARNVCKLIISNRGTEPKCKSKI